MTPLDLTATERQVLQELLEGALRDIRVEEHRTRTPTVRESIIHREEQIASVLEKLRKSAGS